MVVEYTPLRPRWFFAFAAFAVVLGLFGAVAALFGQQTNAYNQVQYSRFEGRNTANALTFSVTIGDIVLGGSLSIILEPDAEHFGSNVLYSSDVTKVYGFPFVAAVNGVTTTVSNGSLLSTMTFSSRLIGNRQMYPFDSYTVPLNIQVYTGSSSLGSDLQLNLNCSKQTFNSYDITWQRPNASPSTAGVQLLVVTITRSGLARVYPVFLIIAFWVIAFAMGAVTLALTLWRYRPVEADYLSMSAGLIFALPALRQTAPDSTDIGNLMDYIAFFWAMLTSVLVFLACLFRYVSQGWPELHLHLSESGSNVFRHVFSSKPDIIRPPFSEPQHLHHTNEDFSLPKNDPFVSEEEL